MLDNIKEEKYKIKYPEPVTMKGTKKILEQMNTSVCRIYNDNNKGTGFFTKIPYKSKLLPVLITNNHIINQNDILNNKNISLYLNNDEIIKTIKLDNRFKYTNEKLDITIIEIKEKKDNLNNKYLELDDEIITLFYFKNKSKHSFNEPLFRIKTPI